jgi:tripartite-type tricarboxylate transporter receptor subunit TctC
MKRILLTVLVVLFVTSTAWASGVQEEVDDGTWNPTKPITIIVPWGAGGATDQVTRILAGELEDALGQRVVIVNTPGASGSVGTNEALTATPDGYTWTAGAAADLGAYRLKGLLDTSWDDWVLYLTVANVGVVAVNADTPYEDFEDLLDGFRARPGEVTVATSGQLSSGHQAIESIVQETGISYRHVTYDGGGPAVTATVAGETELTTQLATESADMIRAGRLRPLAVLDDKPLNLDGFGEIPPVTNWIPSFRAAPNYFGIWVPANVPSEVIETMGEVWDTAIQGNAALSRYAAERGAVFDPAWGEAAREKAMPYMSLYAWTYYESGQTDMSPTELGIPRP